MNGDDHDTFDHPPHKPKATRHHMDSCRALLHVENDEVLHEAIAELLSREALLREALEMLIPPILNGNFPGNTEMNKAIAALSTTTPPPCVPVERLEEGLRAALRVVEIIRPLISDRYVIPHSFWQNLTIAENALSLLDQKEGK